MDNSNRKKIMSPKFLKTFIIGTLLFELLALGTLINSFVGAINTGVIDISLVRICLFSCIALDGLLITELVAIKSYKRTFRETQEIRMDFTKEDVKEIEPVKVNTVTNTKNTHIQDNNDYMKIVNQFYEYCESKCFPFSCSVDLLYKIIYGMKRSGYTNDEIAEYIVFNMYQGRNEKEICKELKLVTKIKV